MYKQPFCSFQFAGVSLTDYGLEIPSPFCSLELTNAQITSFTSWTLQVIVGGDESKKSNIAAFEALIYSASQDANKYPESQDIPVSFMFGWLNEDGSIGENVAYQGHTLKFSTSTEGLYIRYTITGYASLGMQFALPVYNIPALSGFVKPSAVVEGICKALKLDSYYNLDIDHNDVPTMINHGPMTTSLNAYIRGNYSTEDDYHTFPGIQPLTKSYNYSRDAAGLIPGSGNLSTLINNLIGTSVSNYLKRSIVDGTPQCSSFSFWVDEPTMTQRGVIHFKSNAGLLSTLTNDVLQYGTADTNIISISGSYNGIAYNMTNINYGSVGFAVDGSGNTIVETDRVVNSWSATLADVFQSANIVNNANAIASQFSADFTVTLSGKVNQYAICQPVSLVVMSGNTLSPISGIYSVVSVTHNISSTFTTTIKIQRLQMSTANEVATSQGIAISGSSGFNDYSYTATKNIISTGKVDFGNIYPTFEDTRTTA